MQQCGTLFLCLGCAIDDVECHVMSASFPPKTHAIVSKNVTELGRVIPQLRY